MQKNVLHNQSVFDCTLQHTGSFAKIFEFAILNGLSLTDDLAPGEPFKTPTVDNIAMYEFYLARNVIPATAINTLAIIPNDEGIGSMIIENNFIVR